MACDVQEQVPAGQAAQHVNPPAWARAAKMESRLKRAGVQSLHLQGGEQQSWRRGLECDVTI
eukprot:1157780-Pelagomonas_calceolata.AAC.2